jgi:hypothetical protein
MVAMKTPAEAIAIEIVCTSTIPDTFFFLTEPLFS